MKGAGPVSGDQVQRTGSQALALSAEPADVKCRCCMYAVGIAIGCAAAGLRAIRRSAQGTKLEGSVRYKLQPFGFMRFRAQRLPTSDLGGTDRPLHGCRRSR